LIFYIRLCISYKEKKHMAWNNYKTSLTAGPVEFSQGLGMACHLGRNQCRGADAAGVAGKPGTGALRHYKQGDTGPCYEFCATSANLQDPHFEGTIATSKHGSKGGWFGGDDPGVLWPNALGGHGQFASCCEADFAKGACERNSGDVNYHSANFDYTKEWWASRPGSCEVDGGHATVLANMREPKTTGTYPVYKEVTNCSENNAVCVYPGGYTPAEKCTEADSCVQYNPVTFSNSKGYSEQTFTCYSADAMKNYMFNRDNDGQCISNGGLCEGQTADIVLTNRCIQPVCSTEGKLECSACAGGFELDQAQQGTTGVCQWTTDINYWTTQLGGDRKTPGDAVCKAGATSSYKECKINTSDFPTIYSREGLIDLDVEGLGRDTLGPNYKRGEWLYPELGASCARGTATTDKGNCAGDGVRHISTNGDCYEFCSKKSPEGVFQGGIALRSAPAYFLNDELLWPMARGPPSDRNIYMSNIENYNDCDTQFAEKVGVTVVKTNFDYQTIEAWSDPGRCSSGNWAFSQVCKTDDTQNGSKPIVQTYAPIPIEACINPWESKTPQTGLGCNATSVWNCPWEDSCFQYNEGMGSQPTCYSAEGMKEYNLESTPGSKICRSTNSSVEV
jgi:hypothetical protein